MCHFYKHFRWWFLRGEPLCFSWLFHSQQVLCALRIPCVISGNSFGDDFWVGNDSVFLDCSRVNRGCVRWRIHASPLEAVSGAISEWWATQFSLTVYESTGAVWAHEFICHLWKQFRGLFLTGRRLSFPWLFMSQQGLCALTNPWVTSGNIFYDDFWEGSDYVFLDCFWVNRCYVRWGFHASSLEAVSEVIFEWAATQFTLTIHESTRAVWADEFIRHLWKQFRGLFVSGQRLSFPWLFISQQGLCGMTNPSSLVKVVKGANSQWSATQFSLTFSESTGLCGLTNPCLISGNSFRDDFWVGSDSIFLDCSWVNRGCVRWRINASLLEAVSGAIS
jgi:hypothetical protein